MSGFKHHYGSRAHYVNINSIQSHQGEFPCNKEHAAVHKNSRTYGFRTDKPNSNVAKCSPPLQYWGVSHAEPSLHHDGNIPGLPKALMNTL